MNKTFSPRASEIVRAWRLVDASGQTLGRLASEIAIYLRGKHKPTYTPHMDMGDHVVVLNAEKIQVTGRKLKQKVYYRHSGYPGGLKERTLEQQLAKFPARVIESAVRGMLPRTALGEAMYRKLHVYVGPDHPHRGQTEAPAQPFLTAPERATPSASREPRQAAVDKPAPAEAAAEARPRRRRVQPAGDQGSDSKKKPKADTLSRGGRPRRVKDPEEQAT